MRLLIDNNLSPRLSGQLQENGVDSLHVRDVGLRAASDDVVLERARSEARILISADTDFSMILHRTGASAPSVVLVRRLVGRSRDEMCRC